MADSWTRSVVCRYFKNGICYQGNNCIYRHVQGGRQEDHSADAVILAGPPYQIPCRFFKHGICKFGNQCHFRHNEPTDTNSSNTNPTENTADQNVSVPPTPAPVKSITESTQIAEEWVKASEFIPSSIMSTAGSCSSSADEANTSSGISGSMPISYAQAVDPNSKSQTPNPALEPLCPYAEATGVCKKRNCTYIHGDICELCNRAALHPFNDELRKGHTNACVKQHELDMELSFAIQRSREKSCGVCFETIMEKTFGEQRFGILPNCNHCFCLPCIRKWRQAKQFDNKIIRACPECRVTSDFVCPSMYWVDTKEEKEKLIKDYKAALSTKNCKHFEKGRGKCPFGNKCFYLHALPDGTKTDVGPPARQRQNADADVDVISEFILWEYLIDRDERDRSLRETLENIEPFFTDWEDWEADADDLPAFQNEYIFD